MQGANNQEKWTKHYGRRYWPSLIGITESWATTDISDAELGMTGYVMFRKDRIGRRGGGVILYIKESIQAYEIKFEKEWGSTKRYKGCQ